MGCQKIRLFILIKKCTYDKKVMPKKRIFLYPIRPIQEKIFHLLEGTMDLFVVVIVLSKFYATHRNYEILS